VPLCPGYHYQFRLKVLALLISLSEAVADDEIGLNQVSASHDEEAVNNPRES